MIDFVFDGHDWRYKTADEMPGELSMRLPDSQERVILTRKEPNEACKTLGVHIAMDGNQTAQTEYLKEKGQEFADSYRGAGVMERNDAWAGQKLATIMATFRYPAMATTMTLKAWDTVMKPVKSAGLNLSGIACSFPHAVLYGPTLHQGLGLMHPFHFQELEHLETILRCGNSDGTTGKLIQLCIENMRLELGMPGHITDLDYSKLHLCATDSWIKTVWKYSWEKGLTLSDKMSPLPLRRTNDRHLMDVFWEAGHSPEELKMLNQCRMFLHAITLADVTSANGQEITEQAWNGQPLDNVTHAIPFPRNPSQLSASHWTLWQQALTDTVIAPYSLSGRRLTMHSVALGPTNTLGLALQGSW